MGTIFSGRRRRNKRQLVESAVHISADEFVRDAVPSAWRRGTISVRNDAGGEECRLPYTVVPYDDELVLYFTAYFGETPVQQAVPLVWTPACRGGRRLGFACPSRCGRRCRVLYLPPGTHHFACRECHRLTYRSSQEHNPNVKRLRRDPDRLIEQAEQVVEKVKRGEAGFPALLGTIKLLHVAINDSVEQLLRSGDFETRARGTINGRIRARD